MWENYIGVSHHKTEKFIAQEILIKNTARVQVRKRYCHCSRVGTLGEMSNAIKTPTNNDNSNKE